MPYLLIRSPYTRRL